MASGTVKWFKNTYGFITPNDGGQDVFVHYSALGGDGYRTLEAGQTVEYDLTTGKDGRPAAQNVSIVGGTARAAGAA